MRLRTRQGWAHAFSADGLYVLSAGAFQKLVGEKNLGWPLEFRAKALEGKTARADYAPAVV